MDCVRAKSYVGTATDSSGEVKLTGLESDVTGRHVVLVEDIVDTGNTQVKLISAFQKAGVRSVRLHRPTATWWLADHFFRCLRVCAASAASAERLDVTQAASVKIVALLDKTARRTQNVSPHYRGFEVLETPRPSGVDRP